MVVLPSANHCVRFQSRNPFFIVSTEEVMIDERKKLPSLVKFSQLMTKLPYLKAVAPVDRKNLLKQLYQAAREREWKEWYARSVRQGARDARRDLVTLSEISSLLGTALDNVKDARQRYGDLIWNMEDSHLDEWGFSAEQIEDNLRTVIHFVEGYKALSAALIHPELRKPIEKQLAEQRTAAIGDITEEANDYDDYTSGEKFIDLNHELIRSAADILEMFHTPAGKKIQCWETLIKRIFEVALDDFDQTEGAIHAELVRKKKDESRDKQDPVILK
jgi:hypothetical protein